MLSRYFISFNFAMLITFALFYAMQMLISTGEITLMAPNERIKVIFDVFPKPDPIIKKIEPPARPQDIDPPEQQVVVHRSKYNNGPNVGPTELAPEISPVKLNNNTSVFNSEGDFIAIIRPAPRYPNAMAQKGIEGYVRLKYTITTTGSTEDVMVVSSSHRGFERNAVKAAQKFKFKPRVTDGNPQVVYDVYSVLEFKLDG